MIGVICNKCGYSNDFSALKCPCGNRLRYSDEEIYESMSVGQKKINKMLDILENFWKRYYGIFQLIILHVIFLWSMLLYFDTVPLKIIAIEQTILSLVITAFIKIFSEEDDAPFFYVVAVFFVGLTIFSFVITFVYAWYQS